MTEATERIQTVAHSNSKPKSPSDSDCWTGGPCPHCGADQLLVVAAVVDGNYKPSADLTKWTRCPSCFQGSVKIRNVMHPSSKPLREPLGLPEADSTIWQEARACLGVGANAAAAMLCRKLLFHIAVAHGLPAKDEKDRAPRFMQAVNYLEAEGIVTKKMRPWVDRIKDVGNEANHELEPVTAAQALDVATFTEQLLVLAYELDALQAAPEKALDPPGASAVDH